MAKNKDKIELAQNDVPQGYLTLKEASELTPYTPDYIGQLIRAGKIEGKQVYSNVAWVANESSLRSYLDQKGKGSQLSTETAVHDFPELARPLLYIVIVFAALFLIILIHVLSVTIDRAIASALVTDVSETIEVTNDGIVR
jgi:uncharacterized protein involved in cysteine biosynthesis